MRRGRVWVAWQGFRNNNLEVLAAVQNGDSFSQESDRLVLQEQRLGSGHCHGVQWRSRGGLGHLRQGRLRRLFPASAHGWRQRQDGCACAGRGESRVSKPAPRSLTTSRIACGWRTKRPRPSGARITALTRPRGIALYQDHTAKVKCFQGNQAMIPPAIWRPRFPDRAMPGLRRRNGKRAQAQRRCDANAAQSADRRTNASRAATRCLRRCPRTASRASRRIPSGAVYLDVSHSDGRPRRVGNCVGAGSLLSRRQPNGRDRSRCPTAITCWTCAPPMAAIGPGDLMMISVSDHRLRPGGGGGGGRPEEERNGNDKQKPKQQKGQDKPRAVGEPGSAC